MAPNLTSDLVPGAPTPGLGWRTPGHPQSCPLPHPHPTLGTFCGHFSEPWAPRPEREPHRGLFSQQNCLGPRVLTVRWNLPPGGGGAPQGLPPPLLSPLSTASLRNSAGHSLRTKPAHLMPMGTEAQRASIRLKAPQRVSDPAAGRAPSSTSTQCHSRPALTRETKGHRTSQLTCTRSHTCAHVHTRTHLPLPLLQSAHGVPSACARLQSPRPHQAGRAHPSEGPAGSPPCLTALDLVPAADGAGDRSARTRLGVRDICLPTRSP